MATENLEKIVEVLSGLSVLDLSTLKKMLEEKWDVTAAAPMAAMMMAPGAGGDASASVEPSEFMVSLEEVPADKKISVLKVIREMTGLALKEAKEMTEGLPKIVKEKVSKTEAEEVVKKLQDAGGKVSMKGI
ncbi:50S ribosomal protein L7/L12 [Candidatus Clavichlamydia salmonicola]|uniref:50S ribosomal protein L7/L12 n=1 Tax=Candidatus Clavichlamydia salmonicola TaxID=469812 RepID=UPI0018915C40|nr:50S ribosomal protein L7/L12 [Candidatus Clavichlamydia salmonicola]MBF5051104.1 50S ribosomal protein L7/L12 [Candidatus Clavichlamydia salmonicola]